jgi:hypothetical protein
MNYYRPISLLFHTGKLFRKIILSRIEAALHYNQTREQAEFRKGYYSTTDTSTNTTNREDKPV